MTAAFVAIKIISLLSGANGLGQASYLLNIMSFLTPLAAGGIANGVVKRISEKKEKIDELKPLVGTSLWIGCGWSTLLAILINSAAQSLSMVVYGSNEYMYVFRFLAFGQYAISLNALFSAYYSGLGLIQELAIGSTIGYLLGVTGVTLLTIFWGINGCLIGIIWLNVAPGLTVLGMARYGPLQLPIHIFSAAWSNPEFLLLLKFSGMLAASALTIPFTQLYIQSLVHASSGWAGVGYWQAAVRYSDIATFAINALLANYYLPRLSASQSILELTHLITKAYRYTVPALALFFGISVLAPDLIICILFSAKLLPAKNLFFWQVLGTCLKCLAYLAGCFVASQGLAKIYVAGEMLQSVLLCVTGWLLIPTYGTYGASVGYTITYLIYLPTCLYCTLFILRGRGSSKRTTSSEKSFQN